jgi:hypothetical protein
MMKHPAEATRLDSLTAYYMAEGGKPTVLPTEGMSLAAPTPRGLAAITPMAVIHPAPDDESGKGRAASLIFKAGSQNLLLLNLSEQAAEDLSKWFKALSENMQPMKAEPLIKVAP